MCSYAIHFLPNIAFGRRPSRPNPPESARYTKNLTGSALKPQADRIAVLRADLAAVETNRAARRTAEQVARSAFEDSAEAAKRFYNQMQARLTLLFPEDSDFVESCFLDLRSAAPDQGDRGAQAGAPHGVPSPAWRGAARRRSRPRRRSR
jgi:hypothetical protein